jgi:hypothetical protein
MPEAMDSTAERATSSDSEFAAWLGSPVVRVTLLRKHSQWYAEAIDFGMAGVGLTQAAAFRDLAGLVEAYLRSCFREGMDYEATFRPVPHEPVLKPLSLTSLVEFGARAVASVWPGRRSMLVLPSVLHSPHHSI